MLELGPNTLESMSEPLEERDMIDGTYGMEDAGAGNAEGWDVEDEDDVDDGGVEGEKRTLVIFRFGVRYPGIRGRR